MAALKITPFPSVEITSKLEESQLEEVLQIFVDLCDALLRLPESQFLSYASDKSTLPAFLVSFYEQIAQHGGHEASLRASAAVALRRRCFKLVHRIYSSAEHPAQSMLATSFLSNFCQAHIKSHALSATVRTLWDRQSSHLTTAIQNDVKTAIKTLEAANFAVAQTRLASLAAIVHASPEVGVLVSTGSEFLDALMDAYVGLPQAESSLRSRKSISNFVYLGLLSLVRTSPVHTSLLADHLYTLKSNADQAQQSGRITLLQDLVTNTPIVTKVRQTSPDSLPDRVTQLLDSLAAYRTSSISRPPPPRQVSRAAAGKQKSADTEWHVHRMSRVTQLQDLFPDLGAGFIFHLLDEYNDDIEQITANLLEESLPAHLATLDRSEAAPAETDVTNSHDPVSSLAPRSTPPLSSQQQEFFVPDTHNVFDSDDDLVNLTKGKLHIGKKTSFDDDDQQPNKAAILSALAAFDSDDDERDDTYDVDDVGGTVDTAHPDGEPGIAARLLQAENEAALFRAYMSSPGTFARESAVRKSPARAALKRDTGMTDEAIEGWAIMLQREPRRLQRLERQFASGGERGFDGNQAELPSSAYRATEELMTASETEDSDAPGGASVRGGRGAFRGRGRGGGRGGRGGGGAVAGPSGEPGTAQAQRRKEASKGSRANHNRRNQRAKKMARGGFAG